MNPIRLTSAAILLLLVILQTERLQAQSSSKLRLRSVEYIESRKNELVSWSDSVWALAEPSLHEARSSKLIMEILRKEGFAIQENVSGFESVFIATYGEAKPVIGLYGEYDADPNASNRVVPRRDEIASNRYGHGGGHNLLGIGSLGAALAVKELIAHKKLKCSIRYYGTTDEGAIGSKTYLARDGYFDDLDISLYWHPAPVTVASTAPWDALVDLEITLSTPKVNVIQDKNDRPTTIAALEMLMSELHALRSLMTKGIKFNYTLSQSPSSLNESPDSIKVDLRIQCARQNETNKLFEKVSAIVKMVNDKSKVSTRMNVRRAMHQFLPNITAMKVVYDNMEKLGPIQYSDEEIQFVKQLQDHQGQPTEGIQDKIIPFSDQSGREELYGYASDIGDASWIAPEIYFVVNSLPRVPMHQWPGTIFTGHSIGHKGLIQAAKVMTLTIIDYVTSPLIQENIRKDFERSRQNYLYHSILPAGPPDLTKSDNYR